MNFLALRTSNSSSSVVLSSVSSSWRSSFIVVSVDLFDDVSLVDRNVDISSFRISNLTFDPFSTFEDDFDDSKGGEWSTILLSISTMFYKRLFLS